MYVYPPCFTNLALLLNTDMDATKTINEIKQISVLTNDTLNLVLQKNLATLEITDLNIGLSFKF